MDVLPVHSTSNTPRRPRLSGFLGPGYTENGEPSLQLNLKKRLPELSRSDSSTFDTEVGVHRHLSIGQGVSFGPKCRNLSPTNSDGSLDATVDRTKHRDIESVESGEYLPYRYPLKHSDRRTRTRTSCVPDKSQRRLRISVTLTPYIIFIQ